MTNELNDIRNLCIKYDAGKTSLHEEQVLSKFFCEPADLPADLLSYASEFGFYASEKSVKIPIDVLPNPHFISSAWSEIRDFILSKWGAIVLMVLIGASIVFYASDAEVVTVGAKKIRSEQAQEPNIRPERIASIDAESEVDTTYIDQSYITDNKKVKSIEKSEKNPTETNDVRQIRQNDAQDTMRYDFPKSTEKTVSHLDRKSYVDQSFIITQESTSGALARIAYMANKAGIEYTYVVDRHKKVIHELNIVMVIRKTGERSQLWLTYPKKGSGFREQIGWNADSTGQATKLSQSKIEHLVSPKHPLD